MDRVYNSQKRAINYQGKIIEVIYSSLGGCLLLCLGTTASSGTGPGSSGPSLCPSPPGPGGPVPAGGGTGCFGWMWSSCRVPSARLLRLSCPGWPLWAEGPERVRSLRAAWLAGQAGAPPRTGLMAHPGSPPHPHPRLRPGPSPSPSLPGLKTGALPWPLRPLALPSPGMGHHWFLRDRHRRPEVTAAPHAALCHKPHLTAKIVEGTGTLCKQQK